MRFFRTHFNLTIRLFLIFCVIIKSKREEINIWFRRLIFESRKYIRTKTWFLTQNKIFYSKHDCLLKSRTKHNFCVKNDSWVKKRIRESKYDFESNYDFLVETSFSSQKMIVDHPLTYFNPVIKFSTISDTAWNPV